MTKGSAVDIDVLIKHSFTSECKYKYKYKRDGKYKYKREACMIPDPLKKKPIQPKARTFLPVLDPPAIRHSVVIDTMILVPVSLPDVGFCLGLAQPLRMCRK